MFQQYLFRTPFGQFFKLHTSGDGRLPKNLAEKRFSDPQNAKRFLSDFNVSTEFWRRFAAAANIPLKGAGSQADLLAELSHQLVRGKFSFVAVSLIDPVNSPPSKRILGNAGGIQYRFEPTTALLVKPPKETKKFIGAAEAESFIQELDASDEELHELAESLQAVIAPSEPTVNSGFSGQEIRQSIAKKILEEDVTVVVERPRTKTKEGADLQASTSFTRPIPLAPPTLESSEPAKDECIEDNFVNVAYYYDDGSGVEGATFIVTDADTGGEVASGTLPASGEAKVTLPIAVKNVEVKFSDEGIAPTVLKESTPEIKVVKEESSWLDQMGDSLVSFWSGAVEVADWTWGTLQGDFKEDASVGQIVTNAVITMIPVVDQVADVRDLVANLKLLVWDKKFGEFAVWVGLFFTLIGLVPTVGSALKGVLKLIWKGCKLDNLLKVVNWFMKGSGLKWLKELQGGKIAEYADDAAQIGINVFDVAVDKIKYLKGKVPDGLAEVHQSLQATLSTLSEVKSQINGIFTDIANKLTDKLGKIIKEGGEAAGEKGAAKGSVVKRKEAVKPDPDEVLKKIPESDYFAIKKRSMHNIDSETLVLGKYKPTVIDGVDDWTTPSPDSYVAIARTENATYFDLGSEWGSVASKYDLSDDEMFEVFNIPVLDDAVGSGKKIKFTHDPRTNGGFLQQEWDYLKETHGYKSLKEIDGVWYAK